MITGIFKINHMQYNIVKNKQIDKEIIIDGKLGTKGYLLSDLDHWLRFLNVNSHICRNIISHCLSININLWKNEIRI